MVLASGSRGDRLFLEELFLAIDQRVDVVGGELKAVPVGNRICGAGFNAIPAEYAP